MYASVGRGHPDEWYNPGPVLTVSNAVAMEASKIVQPSVPASLPGHSDQDTPMSSFVPASHLIQTMAPSLHLMGKKSHSMSWECQKKCRLNELRSLDTAMLLAHVTVSGQNLPSNVIVSWVDPPAYTYSFIRQ